MMLASLFVLWGREAFHMTQLLQEPMYFVSGLNFPVGQLGFLGALAIALLPLAVGLDAMRQLAFTGGTVVFATPSPGVEMTILVVMAVVFLALARFCLRTMERLARHEGRLTARWR
jgi:ABC-2 type transport system permease protein